MSGPDLSSPGRVPAAPTGAAAVTAPTMTSPAPLTVLDAGDSQLPGAGLRVAGLTVLERAARQLRRQGHAVVATVAPAAPLPRTRYWPEGAELIVTDAENAAATLARTRGASAVIAGNVVRPHSRADAPELRVTDAGSRKIAEDAVFAELLRGDLGLVARHLNKPISFRITRHLLCRLPITPNQVTVAAGLIALCGAGLIATGGRLAMVLGFFLAHVQSVLDGCDGELARVRFQQSATGEWLDTIVDDGLNLALAIAIGVGLWRATGAALFLCAGLGAAAMLLFYNFVAYRELIRQGEGGEVLKIKWWFAKGADLKNLIAKDQRRGFSSILMVLGRRDMFVFLWFVLALCGLTPLIAGYSFLIALSCFLVAAIQLVSRRQT
jgi:phosphatidylglycerophosphate synthase